MSKKHKIIVMSADALVADDMEKLKEMPNFKKYLAGGSCIRHVKSIYPTITYPCHTTMATGCYPDRHGIPGNLKSPYKYIKSPIPWLWEHDNVKVPDIFDAAKAAGLTTAGVFWPCTGKHPSIDWNIAEYWTQSKDQTLADAFREMGSCEELIPIIEKNQHLMVERKHPQCDYFMLACACDMIRQFQPDLFMIHPANIDGARHGNGLFGDHIQKTLEDTDKWIGDLMEAAIESGNGDCTSFVLTSDHGQMDIKRVINLNVYLADAGLIRPMDDGEIQWDAWCQSGGMSACIYLKDKNNREIWQKTYDLLCHMRDEGIYGISKVYTVEESVSEERYGGDFSFVVETDNYTGFGDKYTRPAVTAANNEDYRKGKATHGYLPTKGPTPVFYVNGPAFKSGVEIEHGVLVDEAPTIAAALGLTMPDTDGKPVTELIAE